MSELLNSGRVGLTTIKNLAAQRNSIMEGWKDSGLLAGLKGFKKSNIAQLLENQAQAMLNETTLDGSAGRFDTVAFPIVRRIFSRLLANELVSVQPLALPSGLLFYMDARVSFNGADNSFEGPATGTAVKVAPANTANGQAGPTFASTSAYERFYNNGGFDLSFGTGFTVVNGSTLYSGSSFVGGLYSDQIALGSSFDTTLTQSSASLKFTASTNVYYSAGSTNILVVAAGASVPFYNQIQNYGSDLFANQIADIVYDIRPSGIYGASVNSSLYNNGTTLFGTAFTFSIGPVYQIYNNLEQKSEMAELTIRFSSVTVNTVTRKLRAHWTPELAQDLEAYHSIDAEAELTALLSEHIAAEIDREIIIDLINQAPFKARWDYQGLQNNANFFGTQKDWNQTLITRINELSAQIHKATLRGGANWIVCSAEAGAIFDDLEYFHVDGGSAEPTLEKYNLGVEKIGNLTSRYTVYKDPYLPKEIVLIGHKGNTFLEAGYIYAPYIPLQLTNTIHDPNDFTPRKGIMTRYAKKMVNNRFYGVIYLDNLNTYSTVYTLPQG
jgi:hypothetical protein